MSIFLSILPLTSVHPTVIIMREMVLRVQEAEPVLSPILDQLWAIVAESVDDFRQLPAHQRAVYRTRTRANIINDHMTQRAVRALSGVPGLQLKFQRGQLQITVKDKLRIVLKKLDHRLRPTSIPTQQAMNFVNQMQSAMPGMPDAVTNVVVGYQWNVLQTGLNGVYIVCPHGRQNDWVLEITQPGGVVPLAVAPIPASPLPPRVIPRRSSARGARRSGADA